MEEEEDAAMKLKKYRMQMDQVDELIKADPGNESYLTLKKDIQKIIDNLSLRGCHIVRQFTRCNLLQN